MIERKTVGLLGLANKIGGFTENDARLASAFGKLAAIALLNSQILESLEESEKKYRNLVDTALVGVYKSNLKGDILYINDALVKMLEYDSPEEFISGGAIAKYKNPKDREVLIENL